MKPTYEIQKEFRKLQPFVMPMNLVGIWLVDRGLRATMFLSGRHPMVKRTRIKMITRDGGTLHLRLFTPKKRAGNLPCVLYFPGGGFMMGPNYAHERNCARICAEVGCLVVLAPYRLAPRYTFPTPLSDAEDTYRFLVDHAKILSIDPLRIALSGDSAGGTLTAGLSLLLRDTKSPMPVLEQMLYPALEGPDAKSPSRATYTDTPMFNTKRFRFIEKYFYKFGYFGLERYAFPLLHTDFAGLPPAYIETAEFDCLHDDGVRYAHVLTQAGIPVTLVETKGTFHGYDAVAKSPVTEDCIRRRIASLKQAFAPQP